MELKDTLKNKKAILFDLDGTILDDSNIWNEIYIEFVREECNTTIDLNQINTDWHEHIEFFSKGDFFESYVTYLVKKYNPNRSKIDSKELRKKLNEIADYFVSNKVKYKDYACEVIKLIKEKGYKLGLGSITDMMTLKKYCSKNANIFTKLNMFDYFDEMVLYEDVKNKKPDPEVYLRLLDKMNISREDALVIEDSLTGVEASKNAGIEVLNIKDEASIEKQAAIDKLSDYSLDSMKELYDILLEI